MKTLKSVLHNYKTNTLDGRDITRLSNFLSEHQLKIIGVTLKANSKHKPIKWTKENILKELEEDISFGFDKALNQRGLSASAMYGVVQMWNYILENELADFDSYAMYGLPLFKATANLYGFEDEIDGYDGDEELFDNDEQPFWDLS